MAMMGVPMSSEQRKQIDEKIAARKAEVAASVGKTVDEFKAEQDASRSHNDDPLHCDDRQNCDEDSLEIFPEDVPHVDEDAILTFIRTRQETIDRQNARIRALQAEIRHISAQRDIAERKATALREALTKLRAQIKQQED